jgi:heterodisulfide reductase subunit A
MDCIQFLKEVNLDNNKKKPGRKVAIIGGGNSALDSARTAVRLGCEEVHIIYRRSRREMPANPHEVDEAEREGIKIHYLAAPVRILGDRGKVTGMDCIRMELGEPDASGRRRPVPIKGSGYVVNADFIIPAISQRPDLSFLPKNHGFKITEWNTFAIDEETLESNVSGVFAGGDVATGPKTIIDAIGAGHRGATSIDRYLRGEKLKAARSCETEDFQLVVDGYEHAEMKRTDIPAIPIERRGGFDEVESAMDEEAAVREAKRCLRCGPCVECEACVASCWKKLMAVEGADDEGKRDILVQIPWAPERFPPGNGPWPASVTLKGKSRMEVEAEPVLSRVITRKCRGCGRCKDVCEYRAITLEESGKRLTAVIDPLLCRGCGTCTPVCPSSAIEPLHFGDSKLSRLLSAKG